MIRSTAFKPECCSTIASCALCAEKSDHVKPSHFGSSHFGSSHFGSEPRVACAHCGSSSFFCCSLPFCKTSCDATPRMATNGCAQWVGARDSGTREVASCAPPCFCGPLAFRASSRSPVLRSLPLFHETPRSFLGISHLVSPAAQSKSSRRPTRRS